MRENVIIVEPFQFLSFLKFECIKEVNNHGILKIKGLIADCDVDEYERLAENESWVCVKTIDEDENISIFFRGILTKWEVDKTYGGSVLSIELHTGSYLLDIDPHIRSFQQSTISVSDVMEQCLAATGGKAIILDQKDMSINRFLIQYQETDWEFLLRLAGYAGSMLIPEYITEGKNFYFGYRQGNKEIKMDSTDYKVIRDSGEKYIVISRDIYAVGESVIFRNKKLMIGKIITYLDGGELYHEYHLMTPERAYSPMRKNIKIKGISLLAEVVQVQNTKVQINIQKDENMGVGEYKWFDYATPYSTPDGTGWYCMPEIGDTVRIVFPDDDENNAYVMNSVHLEVEGERDNPEHKSWKNRQNKEILFTPDSLILRNNKGLVVELSDQNGIIITSNKDIVLNADKNISLTSQNSSITVNADALLALVQGCAKVEMNDTINISGGKIFMN